MAKRTFLENTLDQYDQATYHLKLFMLPEGSSAPYDSADGIIIAESGVTGRIFINELSFKSYISLNGKTRNTTSNEFDISLREFSGSTLIDSIFAASLALGIQNHLKARYYIEVSFRARDTFTGAEVIPPNLKWTWPLVIQKIITDVDEGGSSYSIKAFGYNQLAQKEPHILIPHSISLAEVKTVKDATDAIATQLTKGSKDKTTTTTSRPDIYEIVFPTVDNNGNTIENKLGDLELRVGTTVSSTKNRPMTKEKTSDASITNGQIPNNSSVTDAINTIITNSAKYQEMVKQSDTPNDQAKDGKSVKVLHKVDSKVEQLDYDVVRGDYQRKFVYEVIPFAMGTLQTSPNESKTDVSSVRYNTYRDKGVLEKHYNYLFTGENDQVMEFNLQFNQGWYANLPKQGGLYTQSWAANESQHFDDSFKKFIKLREDIMLAIQNMPATQQGAQATSSSLQAKIDAAELPGDQKAQLESLLKLQTNARLQNNARKTGSDKTSKFVTDYKLTPEDFQAYKLLPVTYNENSKDRDTFNAQQGIEGNPGGGREYVNSLFDQAFSGQNADLATIEMTVKGDPYWLGPTRSPDPAPEASYSSQVFLLFTTRTPEIPSMTTGVVDSRPTALNGVYGIWQVDHSFQDGIFKQTLYGVRDPLISISQIEVPD